MTRFTSLSKAPFDTVIFTSSPSDTPEVLVTTFPLLEFSTIE